MIENLEAILQGTYETNASRTIYELYDGIFRKLRGAESQEEAYFKSSSLVTSRIEKAQKKDPENAQRFRAVRQHVCRNLPMYIAAVPNIASIPSFGRQTSYLTAPFCFLALPTIAALVIPIIEGRNGANAALGAGLGLFMGAGLFVVNAMAKEAPYNEQYNNKIKSFRDEAIRVFYATPLQA